MVRKTFYILREECGFCDLYFKVLKQQVQRDLNHPQNIIGLEGPRKHGEAWQDWAEDYAHNSLVSKYFSKAHRKWKWGRGGDSEKWVLLGIPGDVLIERRRIMAFLLSFLRQTAQNNRIYTAKHGREPPTSSVPASMTPAFTTPTRKRKATDYRMSPHDSLMDMAPDEPPDDVRPKRPRRGFPRSEPSPESGLNTNPPPSPSPPLSRSPSPPPSLSSSPSPSPSPSPEPAPTAAELPPPAVLHLPQLVFETKLAATNQSRLIYASQTPTLALFLDKVHEKFALKAHQQVQGIDVWTGTDFITVDLAEERDWAYIANCVARDSTRLRVVVEVSS